MQQPIGRASDQKEKLFSLLAVQKLKREKNFDKELTPIFVLTCDRVTVLIRSLISYLEVIGPSVEIVIHDNHSTYEPMKKLLSELEAAGVAVFRSSEDVIHDRTLSNVAGTINEWMKKSESQFYVVTDPDIELEESAKETLIFFKHLLNTNPEIDAVGPMLRRDDLPEHYPLKQMAISQQEDLYRGREKY